jgi:hypothetical protein
MQDSLCIGSHSHLIEQGIRVRFRVQGALYCRNHTSCSTHQARHPVNHSQVLAHLEALVEGVDVAQVAPRDNHPLRDIPVELLADLDGRRLLALQPQTIERVGQVDGQLGRHLTDQPHAPVEVGVNGQDESAVGDGLD